MGNTTPSANRGGKSYSHIASLYEALKKGENWGLHAIKPDGFKAEFERVTGKKIELTEVGSNNYSIKLIGNDK